MSDPTADNLLLIADLEMQLHNQQGLLKSSAFRRRQMEVEVKRLDANDAASKKEITSLTARIAALEDQTLNTLEQTDGR